MKLTLLLLLPLALASPISTIAPLHESSSHLDDHYIVVLKKGVDLLGMQNHLNVLQTSLASNVSPS
jgi:hypothetical protein